MVKKLWVMFKIELILAIREFSGVLFGVIMPAGVILLLGSIYGNNQENAYVLIQQSFAAVITIGVCATGLMGIPLTIAGYREKRILKRFQVTPTSPLYLLSAQFLTNFTVAAFSSIIVYLIAKFMFDYSMNGSVWLFISAYLLVTLSIYSIGMLIASISRDTKTVNLLATIAYFPMIFLSGATVPFEIMPDILKSFASIMPLTHGIKILKAISTGNTEYSYNSSVMLLLVISLVSIFIALKTFKYDFD